MASSSSWRRVRVERGIYLLPNGKYAVLCRRAGRQFYRTVGSDLALARSAREALIASADAGVAPASPRVQFNTVAGWCSSAHKLAGPFPAGTDWVFATSRGTPYGHRNIARRCLTRAAKLAGLDDDGWPPLRFHEYADVGTITTSATCSPAT